MTDERLQSTPEDVITGRAVPPEMLQDFLNIAALDIALCQASADILSTLPGLVDSNVIKEAIETAGVKPDVVDSIVRTVMNVKPTRVNRFLETVNEWVLGREARSKVFTTEICSQLATNLRLLVQDYPSVTLMKKAEQLLRDVGNEIGNVKFICDLRPVFDEPREKVEAFVLVTTMRLIYQPQHGEQESCEIALSEEELRDLGTQVEKALKKLDVLNSLRSNVMARGNVK